MQQKVYLKKMPPLPKKIQFSNMVLLKTQYIKKGGKTYDLGNCLNLGVNLANFKKTK